MKKKIGSKEFKAQVHEQSPTTQPKRKPMVEVLQSKKAEKLQILEKIYTHEPDPQTITAQVTIKAVSEHNKMEGDYAPEKHAVLGDIEIIIKHEDKGG